MAVTRISPLFPFVKSFLIGTMIVVVLAAIGVFVTVWDKRRTSGEQMAESGGKADRKERRQLWWLLFLPPSVYYLLAAKMSPYMVDRYIMPVFPFAAMAAAGLLLYLWSRRGDSSAISCLPANSEGLTSRVRSYT